jgi:putative FmdB family regulatory protein
MPIYDYVCSACGDRTEVIHGIDAPSPRFCPACGAEGTLRKAFVVPTVHFKGSGWAKKDRSTVSRSAAKADGDGAAAGTDSGADTGPSDGTGKAGDKSDGETSPAGTEKKAPASGDGSTPTSKSGSPAERGKSRSKASGAGTD